MDWATHVPLASLRTSVNTFLCLTDGGHPILGGRQHIIVQTVEPNGAPFIMWFSRARSRVRRRPCMITSLPRVYKGNPMLVLIINYYCIIVIV